MRVLLVLVFMAGCSSSTGALEAVDPIETPRVQVSECNGIQLRHVCQAFASAPKAYGVSTSCETTPFLVTDAGTEWRKGGQDGCVDVSQPSARCCP